jgi:hypothetical protein
MDRTILKVGKIEETDGGFGAPGDTFIERIEGLRTVLGKVDFEGCTALEETGELRLACQDANFRGCSSLKRLSLTTVGGDLVLEGCSSLETLGPLENVLGLLDLQGCDSLYSLGALQGVVGPVIVWEGRKKARGAIKVATADCELLLEFSKKIMRASEEELPELEREDPAKFYPLVKNMIRQRRKALANSESFRKQIEEGNKLDS